MNGPYTEKKLICKCYHNYSLHIIMGYTIHNNNELSCLTRSLAIANTPHDCCCAAKHWNQWQL